MPKSTLMAFVLVRHKVRDYDQWLPGFEEHASARLRSGSKGGHVFRNAHDQNEVFVLMEWESEESALQFVQSQDLQSKMQEVGVVEPPDIYFLHQSANPDS